MNCGIENRSEGYTDSAATGRYIKCGGGASQMNHQQAKRHHRCGCETRAIHRISLTLHVQRFSSLLCCGQSAASDSISPGADSWRMRGWGRGRGGKDALGTAQVWLCGGFVGLADRFTSVHDCWLTCAFTGRRRRLGHCLTNVVQWGLSVHGDWKSKAVKWLWKDFYKTGTEMGHCKSELPWIKIVCDGFWVIQKFLQLTF